MLNKNADGDYVSDCGMFKIAVIDNDEYLPMIREGDGQDARVVYSGLTENYVSLFDAMKILEQY
tara:strand:+ start:1691 stop:1882 length:192 start_codon:yes stop_codon:yes gene_type:complete